MQEIQTRVTGHCVIQISYKNAGTAVRTCSIVLLTNRAFFARLRHRIHFRARTLTESGSRVSQFRFVLDLGFNLILHACVSETCFHSVLRSENVVASPVGACDLLLVARAF